MKNYIFDCEFYLNFYRDLPQNIYEIGNNAILHYTNHGIKESRICCQEELTDIINKNSQLINNQYEMLKTKIFKKEERLLNILIRTSMRPDFFKKCIESVLMQKYTNYNIYVCYDKIESLGYLNDYDIKHKNITIFFVESDSTEKYKFNLYNNELIDKVTGGFILFLDDDDIFTHDLCFKIINENITGKKDLLIWKFMRPDKIIYPKNVNDIKLGDIDTTMVCFHSKFKRLSKWGDKQCGDYYFFKRLFKSLKKINKLNIINVNYILTKTSFHEKMCGSI